MSTRREPSTRVYARRMDRVIDFISAHLHEELSIEQLAKVASSSKYHFQRQFTAYTGITVAKLIRLMRLKRASYQLAFNPHCRIIDIALEAGFRSPEAFSRAFKNTYGQTPSEFRARPKWRDWVVKHQDEIAVGSTNMNVEVINFPTTRVAVLEHLGSPGVLNASVARFIEWRKQSKLSPIATSRTFGVPYSDPEQAPPEEWRFDICGSVNCDVPANPQGVITKTLPGGRCAVAEHRGSTDAINQTVIKLYADWLPASGEELRDFPCFFEYLKRMPMVAEHEQLTKVYLPLR